MINIGVLSIISIMCSNQECKSVWDKHDEAPQALKNTRTGTEDVSSVSSVSEQKKQTTTKSSGKKKSKKKKKKEKEKKKIDAPDKNMMEWEEYKLEFLNTPDSCKYSWDVSSNLVKKNDTFSKETIKNGNVILKRLHRRIKEMHETLRPKLSIDQKKKLAILKAVVRRRRQWLCKPNEAIEKKSYLCVDIDTILNEIESEA